MLTVLRAESRRDENGRKRVVKEMLTDYPSHFSCRYFSWFQKSRQNYHSRSLAPAIRMCEQYTIRQGFSLQVPLYKCVYIALKRIHLIVHFGYEYIFHAAVDKTRNMEHPGTFRNIPEHPGTSRNMKKLKYFFMKK